MSFGERLREKRLACHMTMESLAIMVGTSRQTIQRYESGRITTPPYEKIEALAAALCTTPGALIGWGDAPCEVQDEPLPKDFVCVADDAMAGDRILERDLVYYHRTEAPSDGQLVVGRLDGVTMVRRYYRMPDGVCLLASNSTYPPIFLPEQAGVARWQTLGVAAVLRTLL